MLFDLDLEVNLVERDVRNPLRIRLPRSEVYIEEEMDRRAWHLTAISQSNKLSLYLRSPT